ncbi:TonB-dependent receptor [Pacificimonas sp. WHA3]|uniref:TonB-dependent receptor n=1 Tax=Pacificimonas pallii TaxID=2827236 RepID=A0ABS6SG32_9SPHN|nr:TonB-dependent receptor [Pacificimonas pallii]MBV7257377.1 TonB-dependent receptor [Pacificimonas pallii]
MNKKKLPTGALLSCAAILALQSAPALAQQAPEDAAAEEAAQEASDVILVTARRRTETILDVPASLTVIGGDAIETQAILDFSEIGRFAPNVFTEESGNRPGRTRSSIRGIADRAGIYIDDVFVGDSSAANTLLVDIDRVEVLRGPQGAFFGRNTSAGAINFHTRVPSNDFDGAFIGRYGSHEFLNLSGLVTGPLIEDQLAFKLAGGIRRHHGYDRTVSGLHVNGEDQLSLRGELYLTPGYRFTARLALTYDRDKPRVGYLDAIEDFGALGNVFGHAAADAKPFDRILPDLNIESRTRREVIGAYLTLGLETGFGEITSITGYRDAESDNFRDPDGGLADVISGNQPLDYSSFSQEFKITGEHDRVSWLAGLYYFNDRREESDLVRLGPDFVVDFNPALAPWTGSGLLTIQNLFDNPTAQVAPGVFLPLSAVVGFAAPTPYGDRSTFKRRDVESYAAFGAVTFELTDTLEATIGGRYTHEKIRGAFSQQGVAWSPLDPDVPLQRLSKSNDDFSPSASLTYRYHDDGSVYVTVSRGFQSGGFNLDPGGTPLAERDFDAESVMNYEIGLRNSFAGGRVTTAFTGFYQKYKDFQRRQSISTNTGQITQTFNADADVVGFEAELAARITDHFDVTAAIGYQKAEYGTFANAPISTPDGVVIADLTGSPLPIAPNFTGSFSARYSHPISDSVDLNFGVDGQYRDEYTVIDGAEVAELPYAVAEEAFLLNADIGLSLPDDFGIRVRVQNILNEEYITALNFVQQTGTITSALSAPRTFFVELSKRF